MMPPHKLGRPSPQRTPRSTSNNNNKPTPTTTAKKSISPASRGPTKATGVPMIVRGRTQVSPATSGGRAAKYNTGVVVASPGNNGRTVISFNHTNDERGDVALGNNVLAAMADSDNTHNNQNNNDQKQQHQQRAGHFRDHSFLSEQDGVRKGARAASNNNNNNRPSPQTSRTASKNNNHGNHGLPPVQQQQNQTARKSANKVASYGIINTVVDKRGQRRNSNIFHEQPQSYKNDPILEEQVHTLQEELKQLRQLQERKFEVMMKELQQYREHDNNRNSNNNKDENGDGKKDSKYAFLTQKPREWTPQSQTNRNNKNLLGKHLSPDNDNNNDIENRQDEEEQMLNEINNNRKEPRRPQSDPTSGFHRYDTGRRKRGNEKEGKSPKKTTADQKNPELQALELERLQIQEQINKFHKSLLGQQHQQQQDQSRNQSPANKFESTQKKADHEKYSSSGSSRSSRSSASSSPRSSLLSVESENNNNNEPTKNSMAKERKSHQHKKEEQNEDSPVKRRPRHLGPQNIRQPGEEEIPDESGVEDRKKTVEELRKEFQIAKTKHLYRGLDGDESPGITLDDPEHNPNFSERKQRNNNKITNNSKQQKKTNKKQDIESTPGVSSSIQPINNHSHNNNTEPTTPSINEKKKPRKQFSRERKFLSANSNNENDIAAELKKRASSLDDAAFFCTPSHQQRSNQNTTKNQQQQKNNNNNNGEESTSYLDDENNNHNTSPLGDNSVKLLRVFEQFERDELDREQSRNSKSSENFIASASDHSSPKPRRKSLSNKNDEDSRRMNSEQYKNFELACIEAGIPRIEIVYLGKIVPIPTSSSSQQQQLGQTNNNINDDEENNNNDRNKKASSLSLNSGSGSPLLPMKSSYDDNLRLRILSDRLFPQIERLRRQRENVLLQILRREDVIDRMIYFVERNLSKHWISFIRWPRPFALVEEEGPQGQHAAFVAGLKNLPSKRKRISSSTDYKHLYDKHHKFYDKSQKTPQFVDPITAAHHLVELIDLITKYTTEVIEAIVEWRKCLRRKFPFFVPAYLRNKTIENDYDENDEVEYQNYMIIIYEDIDALLLPAWNFICKNLHSSIIGKLTPSPLLSGVSTSAKMWFIAELAKHGIPTHIATSTTTGQALASVKKKIMNDDRNWNNDDDDNEEVQKEKLRIYQEQAKSARVVINEPASLQTLYAELISACEGKEEKRSTTSNNNSNNNKPKKEYIDDPKLLITIDYDQNMEMRTEEVRKIEDVCSIDPEGWVHMYSSSHNNNYTQNTSTEESRQLVAAILSSLKTAQKNLQDWWEGKMSFSLPKAPPSSIVNLDNNDHHNRYSSSPSSQQQAPPRYLPPSKSSSANQETKKSNKRRDPSRQEEKDSSEDNNNNNENNKQQQDLKRNNSSTMNDDRCSLRTQVAENPNRVRAAIDENANISNNNNDQQEQAQEEQSHLQQQQAASLVNNNNDDDDEIKEVVKSPLRVEFSRPVLDSLAAAGLLSSNQADRLWKSFNGEEVEEQTNEAAAASASEQQDPKDPNSFSPKKNDNNEYSSFALSVSQANAPPAGEQSTTNQDASFALSVSQGNTSASSPTNLERKGTQQFKRSALNDDDEQQESSPNQQQRKSFMAASSIVTPMSLNPASLPNYNEEQHFFNDSETLEELAAREKREKRRRLAALKVPKLTKSIKKSSRSNIFNEWLSFFLHQKEIKNLLYSLENEEDPAARYEIEDEEHEAFKTGVEFEFDFLLSAEALFNKWTRVSRDIAQQETDALVTIVDEEETDRVNFESQLNNIRALLRTKTRPLVSEEEGTREIMLDIFDSELQGVLKMHVQRMQVLITKQQDDVYMDDIIDEERMEFDKILHQEQEDRAWAIIADTDSKAQGIEQEYQTGRRNIETEEQEEFEREIETTFQKDLEKQQQRDRIFFQAVAVLESGEAAARAVFEDMEFSAFEAFSQQQQVDQTKAREIAFKRQVAEQVAVSSFMARSEHLDEYETDSRKQILTEEDRAFKELFVEKFTKVSAKLLQLDQEKLDLINLEQEIRLSQISQQEQHQFEHNIFTPHSTRFASLLEHEQQFASLFSAIADTQEPSARERILIEEQTRFETITEVADAEKKKVRSFVQNKIRQQVEDAQSEAQSLRAQLSNQKFIMIQDEYATVSKMIERDEDDQFERILRLEREDERKILVAAGQKPTKNKKKKSQVDEEEQQKSTTNVNNNPASSFLIDYFMQDEARERSRQVLDSETLERKQLQSRFENERVIAARKTEDRENIELLFMKQRAAHSDLIAQEEADRDSVIFVPERRERRNLQDKEFDQIERECMEIVAKEHENLETNKLAAARKEHFQSQAHRLFTREDNERAELLMDEEAALQRIRAVRKSEELFVENQKLLGEHEDKLTAKRDAIRQMEVDSLYAEFESDFHKKISSEEKREWNARIEEPASAEFAILSKKEHDEREIDELFQNQDDEYQIHIVSAEEDEYSRIFGVFDHELQLLQDEENFANKGKFVEENVIKPEARAREEIEEEYHQELSSAVLTEALFSFDTAALSELANTVMQQEDAEFDEILSDVSLAIAAETDKNSHLQLERRNLEREEQVEREKIENEHQPSEFTALDREVTKFEKSVRQIQLEKYHADLALEMDQLISDQARERAQIVTEEKSALKPIFDEFTEIQSLLAPQKQTREDIKRRIKEREDRLREAKMLNGGNLSSMYAGASEDLTRKQSIEQSMKSKNAVDPGHLVMPHNDDPMIREFLFDCQTLSAVAMANEEGRIERQEKERQEAQEQQEFSKKNNNINGESAQLLRHRANLQQQKQKFRKRRKSIWHDESFSEDESETDEDRDQDSSSTPSDSKEAELLDQQAKITTPTIFDVNNDCLKRVSPFQIKAFRRIYQALFDYGRNFRTFGGVDAEELHRVSNKLWPGHRNASAVQRAFNYCRKNAQFQIIDAEELRICLQFIVYVNNIQPVFAPKVNIVGKGNLSKQEVSITLPQFGLFEPVEEHWDALQSFLESEQVYNEEHIRYQPYTNEIPFDLFMWYVTRRTCGGLLSKKRSSSSASLDDSDSDDSTTNNKHHRQQQNNRDVSNGYIFLTGPLNEDDSKNGKKKKSKSSRNQQQQPSSSSLTIPSTQYFFGFESPSSTLARIAKNAIADEKMAKSFRDQNSSAHSKLLLKIKQKQHDAMKEFAIATQFEFKMARDKRRRIEEIERRKELLRQDIRSRATFCDCEHLLMPNNENENNNNNNSDHHHEENPFTSIATRHLDDLFIVATNFHPKLMRDRERRIRREERKMSQSKNSGRDSNNNNDLIKQQNKNNSNNSFHNELEDLIEKQEDDDEKEEKEKCEVGDEDYEQQEIVKPITITKEAFDEACKLQWPCIDNFSAMIRGFEYQLLEENANNISPQKKKTTLSTLEQFTRALQFIVYANNLFACFVATIDDIGNGLVTHDEFSCLVNLFPSTGIFGEKSSGTEKTGKAFLQLQRFYEKKLTFFGVDAKNNVQRKRQITSVQDVSYDLIMIWLAYEHPNIDAFKRCVERERKRGIRIIKDSFEEKKRLLAKQKLERMQKDPTSIHHRQGEENELVRKQEIEKMIKSIPKVDPDHLKMPGKSLNGVLFGDVKNIDDTMSNDSSRQPSPRKTSVVSFLPGSRNDKLSSNYNNFDDNNNDNNSSSSPSPSHPSSPMTLGKNTSATNVLLSSPAAPTRRQHITAIQEINKSNSKIISNVWDYSRHFLKVGGLTNGELHDATRRLWPGHKNASAVERAFRYARRDLNAKTVLALRQEVSELRKVLQFVVYANNLQPLYLHVNPVGKGYITFTEFGLTLPFFDFGAKRANSSNTFNRNDHSKLVKQNSNNGKAFAFASSTMFATMEDATAGAAAASSSSSTRFLSAAFESNLHPRSEQLWDEMCIFLKEYELIRDEERSILLTSAKSFNELFGRAQADDNDDDQNGSNKQRTQQISVNDTEKWNHHNVYNAVTRSTAKSIRVVDNSTNNNNNNDNTNNSDINNNEQNPFEDEENGTCKLSLTVDENEINRHILASEERVIPFDAFCLWLAQTRPYFDHPTPELKEALLDSKKRFRALEIENNKLQQSQRIEQENKQKNQLQEHYDKLVTEFRLHGEANCDPDHLFMPEDRETLLALYELGTKYFPLDMAASVSRVRRNSLIRERDFQQIVALYWPLVESTRRKNLAHLAFENCKDGDNKGISASFNTLPSLRHLRNAMLFFVYANNTVPIFRYVNDITFEGEIRPDQFQALVPSFGYESPNEAFEQLVKFLEKHQDRNKNSPIPKHIANLRCSFDLFILFLVLEKPSYDVAVVDPKKSKKTGDFVARQEKKKKEYEQYLQQNPKQQKNSSSSKKKSKPSEEELPATQQKEAVAVATSNNKPKEEEQVQAQEEQSPQKAATPEKQHEQIKQEEEIHYHEEDNQNDDNQQEQQNETPPSPPTPAFPKEEILSLLRDIHSRNQEIKLLSEVGSPSDADLKKLEQVKHLQAEKKLSASTRIMEKIIHSYGADHHHALTSPSCSSLFTEEEQTFIFDDIFSVLITEGDRDETGNCELAQALVQLPTLDWVSEFENKKHECTAAFDGSLRFVEEIFLDNILVDMTERCIDDKKNKTCRYFYDPSELLQHAMFCQIFSRKTAGVLLLLKKFATSADADDGNEDSDDDITKEYKSLYFDFLFPLKENGEEEGKKESPIKDEIQDFFVELCKKKGSNDDDGDPSKQKQENDKDEINSLEDDEEPATPSAQQLPPLKPDEHQLNYPQNRKQLIDFILFSNDRQIINSKAIDLEFETSDGQTVFSKAAKDGDVELMKILLPFVDPGRVSIANETTPLIQAVFGNQVETVEFLLSSSSLLNDFNVDHKTKEGDALFLAQALKRDERIVKAIENFKNNTNKK